jgi:HEAT repeat protein
LGVLDAYEIRADVESIRSYLESLQADEQARRQRAVLIDQLGDADYHRREQAMKQLLPAPLVAVDQLEEAARNGPPEVRWRARQILDQAEQRFAELLLAVYRTVEQQQLAGLCEPLLASIPLVKDDYLREAARRALTVTVTPADAEFLRHQLSSPDAELRIAALTALAKLLGGEADPLALQMLGDADDRVRIAAARVLADHGRRESLPALQSLLNSSELAVRVSTIKTLRSMTGKDFGFAPYEDFASRAAAVGRWQQWLATEGNTAPLYCPLKDEAYELGRTLVCDYRLNRVIEFDAAGKQIWEAQVGQQPWSCQGLPNGHRLVTSYGDRSVVEFDSAGKQIWKQAELPGGPTSVQRLDNGNTLMACTDSNQIVEIDREGAVVWQVTMAGRPCDAQRLDDGRTLVALQQSQRVVEIDRSGNVVWEMAAVSPFAVQRIESGNTLVCSMGSGQVIECDRGGKTVWSKDGLRNPYDAQRLSNGNTLIVDGTGLTEFDPVGKVVWQKSMASVSRACRY